MNFESQSQVPLIFQSSESESVKEKRDINYKLHITFFIISLVWYYFINQYTDINYKDPSCENLRNYMIILQKYYFWLIVIHTLCFILETIFINTYNIGEQFLDIIKISSKIIFSIYGLFNVISVNYAYSQSGNCDGLGTVALIWLIMVNSATGMVLLSLFLILSFGLSILHLLKYI